MKFNQQLSEYMEVLSCSAKDICAISGISPASFSRYKNGGHVPELGTKTFENLCKAISKLAKDKGIEIGDVSKAFIECEDFVATDKELLRQNFNTLISALDINLSQLSQYINYDTSAIFRIRNGSRKPGDVDQFASSVASFVAREMETALQIAAVAELIDCDVEEIGDLSIRYNKIKTWLLESQGKEAGDTISAFLYKLDEFDLNEYIKVIKFDEIKVPTVPFQIPSSKTYFGLEEMMESEIDFIKATVLSKSMEPVTMYSDMPIKEMAKDKEFPKKWMFGLAMMLKKGLHLNQIHNVDRNFDEMMLGLESWIPMYMTGQISPYYFKNVQGNVFLHLLKVSGAAALSGQAIAGYHNDGSYYLTKNKKELEYYQKRADEMLKNAYPLMEIYRSNRRNELNTFLLKDVTNTGKRRSILSTLPLYTISDELLYKILDRNNIEYIDEIKKYLEIQRERVNHILENEIIEDEVPSMFSENSPQVLELSRIFWEEDITYNKEEYEEHLNLSKEFMKKHPNYKLKCSSGQTFRNLQIHIHEGKWAMVSKAKAPAIHFVIKHPKLRSAIENFIPPIKD